MADLTVAVVEAPITAEWFVVGLEPILTWTVDIAVSEKSVVTAATGFFLPSLDGIAAEQVATADAALVVPLTSAVASESVTATESVTMKLAGTIVDSESVVTVGTTSIFLPWLSVSAVEQVVATDAPTLRELSFVAATETVRGVETPQTLLPFLLVTVLERAVTTETLTQRYAEFLVHIIEPQVVSDAAVLTETGFVNVSETVRATDALGLGLGLTVSVSEGVTAKEGFQAQTQPTVTERVAALDAPTVNLVSFIARSETAITQEASLTTFSIVVISLSPVRDTAIVAEAVAIRAVVPPVTALERVVVMDAPTLNVTVSLVEAESTTVSERVQDALSTGFQIHVAEQVLAQDHAPMDVVYRWVQETAEVAPSF